MAMAVLAAGHNAWGQLSFGGLDGVAVAEESGDIFTFAKVLQGGSLSRPRARLAYTLGTLHLWTRGRQKSPTDTRPFQFLEKTGFITPESAATPTYRTQNCLQKPPMA